jgi:pantoate--beta-alanine ligase
MYPRPETRIYDFGALANVMEGRFRQGHFNGVGIVVEKLFRIIEPDRAYFGEKDYQQLAIIRRLVELEQIPVEIIPCPIIRESDGLAMSSRNIRLTPEHRKAAPLIYRTLSNAAGMMGSSSPGQLSRYISATLNDTGFFQVEYVEFADETTLETITGWSESKDIRCFIALHAGEVRLIDNLNFHKQE